MVAASMANHIYHRYIAFERIWIQEMGLTKSKIHHTGHFSVCFFFFPTDTVKAAFSVLCKLGPDLWQHSRATWWPRFSIQFSPLLHPVLTIMKTTLHEPTAHSLSLPLFFPLHVQDAFLINGRRMDGLTEVPDNNGWSTGHKCSYWED